MARRDDELGVYFVDVGQGDGTIVVPPGDDPEVVVFDCNDDNVVCKLLDNWGVRRISAVIISHLDRDHIAGLPDLLSRYAKRIRRVFVPSDRDVREASDGSVKAKELIDQILEGERAGQWDIVSASRDSRPVVSGNGWRIDVIAPPGGKALAVQRTGVFVEANEYSAILRIERSGTTVLVGGDAPLQAFYELEDEERRADVLRVPHHGGDSGRCQDANWDASRLYGAVGCKCAVVSVGSGNDYGHPDPKWILPVVDAAGRLVCTQVMPRCEPTIRADAKVWRDIVLRRSHFAEPPWRHLKDDGRSIKRGVNEVPCAGTVVVTIDG